MGGDHYLARLCAAVNLLNKLRGGLTARLGVARIDGDDFRVQEFHQRRATDACNLEAVDALFL